MESRKTISMSVLDNAPFGFAKLGPDFRISDLNSTLCEMIGTSRAEAVGTDFRDFVTDNIKIACERALNSVRTEEDARATTDIYIKNPIGEFACKLTVWKGTNELEDEFFATLSEMSELKMYMRLRESEQLLEESLQMASVGVIAGGLTHEINQPLNAICIATDGIRTWNEISGRALPESITKLIGRVSVAAQRIDTIVKRVRLYWASDPAPISELLDPARLIEDSLLMIKQKILNHEIELVSDCQRNLGLVKVNASKFEMIINNLALEAIISLDKSDRKDKRLAIKLLRRSDKIVITIADNGEGFRTVPAEKLFDPYEREKSVPYGPGLGLAIADMFARWHGGNIQRSVRDGWEEFILEVPAADGINE